MPHYNPSKPSLLLQSFSMARPVIQEPVPFCPMKPQKADPRKKELSVPKVVPKKSQPFSPPSELSEEEWPKPEVFFQKAVVEFPKQTNVVQFFRVDTSLLPDVSPDNAKLSHHEQKEPENDANRSLASHRFSADNFSGWRSVQAQSHRNIFESPQ